MTWEKQEQALRAMIRMIAKVFPDQLKLVVGVVTDEIEQISKQEQAVENSCNYQETIRGFLQRSGARRGTHLTALETAGIYTLRDLIDRQVMIAVGERVVYHDEAGTQLELANFGKSSLAKIYNGLTSVYDAVVIERDFPYLYRSFN